jgi:hypothetical protein
MSEPIDSSMLSSEDTFPSSIMYDEILAHLLP